MSAGELHTNTFPGVAASLINPKTPVSLDVNGKRQVLPVATNNVRPFGLSGQASAAAAEAITVYTDLSTVEARAAASLGAGGVVGVASTNGALGPISGASGVTRFAVGQAVEAAAAGEVFSLYVRPVQLSNLI